MSRDVSQEAKRSGRVLTDAADVREATLADGDAADAATLQDRLTRALHRGGRGVRGSRDHGGHLARWSLHEGTASWQTAQRQQQQG